MPRRIIGERRALSFLATLLPLAVVVGAIALGARPPAPSVDRVGNNLPTRDTYEQALRSARFAPTWRAFLKNHYAALDKRRRTLADTHDPVGAAVCRRSYAQAAALYNAIAAAAPQEAFTDPPMPRHVPLSPR